MATGFVQRWKGKVLAQLLGVGSGGITLYSQTGTPNVSPLDLMSIQGFGSTFTASTATLAINGYGLTLVSSVGGSTYALGAPVRGRQAVIYTNAIGDGTRKISAAAAGATFQSTLAGAAILNLSTVAVQSITLLGLSTAAWLIEANNGTVTVSTS